MNLKRKMAMVMAAVMLFQVPISSVHSVALANDTEDLEFESEDFYDVSTPANASIRSNSEDVPALMSLQADTGVLKIEITGAAPTESSNWTAELTPIDEDPTTGVQTKTFELGASIGSYSHASVVMEQIPIGEYALRLSPDEDMDTAYLPYEQDVMIGKNVTTLRLINGDPNDYGYSEGASRYGILAIGDIDADGVIDEEDLGILIKAVASNVSIAEKEEVSTDYSAEDKRSDLNGDGSVDLLDVALFAKYYQNDFIEENSEATPTTSALITKEEVSVAAENNATPKEGSASVEEIFSGLAETSLQVETEEVISEDTPAVIATEFQEAKPMEGIVIDPVAGSEDSIVDGEIIVTDEDEEEHIFTVKDGKVVDERTEMASNSSASGLMAFKEAIGTFLLSLDTGIIAYAEEADTSSKYAKPIVIDLGGQVAVKKITIKVTKTLAENPKLVDISKVEFYDDMADRIPEPELSIPEKLEVVNGSESFTVTWKNVQNVSSYEVTITGMNEKHQTATEVKPLVETNSIEVTSFDNGDVMNGYDYTVVVRSVNGNWRSEGASVIAHPDTSALPPAPENVVLDPGYGQIKVGWKKMKDTHTYTMYYREVMEDETVGPESHVDTGEEVSYTITGLKNDTEYEVWVVGHRTTTEEVELTGPESIHYKARTSTLNPPETPNYKLINIPKEGEDLTSHIVSTTLTHGYNSDGSTGNSNVVVDGNYATSWILDDLDAGYHYGNRMPVVKFDNRYTMNTIVLIPDENQTYSYSGGKIFYVDENGKEQEAIGHMNRLASNGKYYYMFISYAPFTTDQVRLATYAYSSNRRISVAELKFYNYDEVEDEIMDLYADTYHISLKPEVNEEKIQELRDKLEYVDEETQEQHPRKKELNYELDNAVEILNNQDKKCEILIVDNKDTQAADKYITFKGGLNTYQPLGVTALAGDSLTLYVGGPNVRNGDSTRLELVAAQYHGSSAAVFVSLGYLKAGSNTVQVKAVDKMSDFERGGQLYVHYTGNAGAEEYGVRVLGGRKSAALDISDITDHDEKVSLAEKYIADVKEQLNNAEAYHDADHGLNSEAKTKFEDDPQNCVYHATDIVSKYAMFSTSVDQVIAGLKEATNNGTDRELAEQLVNTMDAMDQMLVLYYHHKGLSSAPDAGEKNAMPVSRINIRYQRMFYGAFMYAGGKHIGIEWPELKGLMGAHPIVSDENGKYESGNYFGFGIGHEIGHEINESAYVTAEVTNNYFSLLAQAEQSKNYNDDVRFKYDDVYKKVTSGTKGKASNVFIQLAMYWQLHLAYDLEGYNYKIFDTSEDQLNNLFWARVDSYVRDPSKAPGEKGNTLDLETDKDNKLMRLAVASSQRDLLEMFVRYGYEPNEGTIKYASQFPEESRALWFANDELRAKQIEAGGNSGYQNYADSASVSGEISYKKGSNKVSIDLKSNSDIWMYEVYRSERVKGEVIKRPVGYAEADESGNAVFTDVIGSINNRAFTYEAVGYDMWLNPTKEVLVDEVKVSHDGLIDKSLWTVDSNMTNDKLSEPSVANPDAVEQPGLDDMVDDKYETSFTGSAKATEESTGAVTPEIIINFNNQETVTGLRYSADAGVSFKAYVSMNAAEWTPVEMKTMENTGDEVLVYFDDGTNLYTYDAAYMKLVAEDSDGPITDGREITISEISVLGQTGDNVEMTAEDGIGILSETYVNGTASIPEGSLIFTGTYKGNPAYNAVLLWDEEGNIVGGMDEEGTVYAEQIIFAPQPQGKLNDVSEGHWVYYIAPSLVDSVKADLAGHKVRAELYRVDDAKTNAGERLVSSTVFVTIPNEIPNVQLSTGGAMQ